MKLTTGLFAVILLSACQAASASFISMATEFSITDTGGLELTVSSQNRGDETAYGVQFEIDVGSKHLVSTSVAQLGVNQTTRETFPINDAFTVPGHYPVVIKTHYKDANSYPFSALAAGFYDHLEPVVSRILVRAEDVKIPSNGKSRVNFVIRNNDPVPRTLDLVLYLPDELAAVTERQTVSVAPKSEEIVRYTVENFSALEDSGYAIVLIAQYEDGGRHFSASGSVVAQITGPAAVSGVWLWVIGGIVVVVMILMGFAIARRRK